MAGFCFLFGSLPHFIYNGTCLRTKTAASEWSHTGDDRVFNTMPALSFKCPGGKEESKYLIGGALLPAGPSGVVLVG